MPEISRFLGIALYMYYSDHQPPHFHARYGEWEAIIAIDDGHVIAGRLPRRASALIEEWRRLHREELRNDWLRAEARLPLHKIDPLE